MNRQIEARLEELSTQFTGLCEVVTRLVAEDIDARPAYWRAVDARFRTASMMATGEGPHGAARREQLAELRKKLPVIQEVLNVLETAYLVRKEEDSGAWRDWLDQCTAEGASVDDIRDRVLAEPIQA